MDERHDIVGDVRHDEKCRNCEHNDLDDATNPAEGLEDD